MIRVVIVKKQKTYKMKNLFLCTILILLITLNQSNSSIISDQINERIIRQNPILYNNAVIQNVNIIESEQMYQDGMIFFEEARSCDGVRGAEQKQKIAYNRGVQYLKKAALSGHVEAKIRLEIYDIENNMDTYKHEIEQFSSCYTMDVSTVYSCFCNVCCVYTSCIPILGCILTMNINSTTEEQIKQTHIAYNQKIDELTRLESLTKYPILKLEVGELKERMIYSKKEYDINASLYCSHYSVCFGKGGFGVGKENPLFCCNYKIRDAASIN